MEGNKNKPIYSDPEFDRLIPKPKGTTETIKRNARLEDTINFLPDAMQRVTWQVKKILYLVQGENLEDTCHNIWKRLYRAIRYQRDDENKEQIRSPRCTWWGRRADCDDFSVFVSAILCNLRIPHLFRIAMYTEENGYQHIYPVAIAPDGTEIVIDCVLNRFNKEVPYIQKIDKHMELQFLDGVEDGNLFGNPNSIDAADLLQGDLGELGKKFKDSKLAQKLKKGLHVINRANPATVLLRTGILACMKINLFNVAGLLRFSYLTEEQAKKKHFDMARFSKLKNIREKLEKIFYGAGGKEENLRKAILTGRGNKNKEVPLGGLGEVDIHDYTEHDRLPQLLGATMYNDEMTGVEGLGDLGIATEAAIAAASSAIAALAAIIKQIGPLRKGNNSDTSSADSSANNTTSTDTSSSASSNTDSGSTVNTNTPADTSALTTNSTNTTQTPTDGGANSTTDTPATTTDSSNTGDDGSGNGNSNQRDANPTPNANKSTTPTTQNDGFIKKATDWAKNNKAAATIIGIAVVSGLGFGGYKLATMNKAKKNQPALSGAPKRRKGKHNGAHGKHKVKIKKLR